VNLVVQELPNLIFDPVFKPLRQVIPGVVLTHGMKRKFQKMTPWKGVRKNVGGALRAATGPVGTVGIARRRQPPTFKKVRSLSSSLGFAG